MVSSALSSPFRMMAVAGPGLGLPSAKAAPLLRRAHRSRVISDFPRSGSPSSSAGLPSGRRPGQSQATSRGWTWLTRRKGREVGGGGAGGMRSSPSGAPGCQPSVSRPSSSLFPPSLASIHSVLRNTCEFGEEQIPVFSICKDLIAQHVSTQHSQHGQVAM
jgi:hypothetical protein